MKHHAVRPAFKGLYSGVIIFFTAAVFSGCSTTAKEMNKSSTTAEAKSESLSGKIQTPFLMTGLWADYDGKERQKIPLGAAAVSTFPSTAKKIYWYARLDTEERLKHIGGKSYSIRWISPEGSVYEENSFPASVLDGGIIMSPMKVPFRFDKSLSGRWRVEVSRNDGGIYQSVDEQSFWLMETVYKRPNA